MSASACVSRPRVGWYGDDLTGATDTLATWAERGHRALLFLRPPTSSQLAAAGPLDAVGIAGAARSMPPDAAAAELHAAGRAFAALGVDVVHYKCCSTFDSAPDIGSIGAAVAVLRRHVANPLVPILGGQPNLGRYCLFGNLFAAAGAGGAVHRIDRHPTMSKHPVTPMAEADLRRHLTAQGLERVALIDYRAYAEGDAETRLDANLAAAPHAVLFDVAQESDLAVIGRLLTDHLVAGPMLAVGPSSVARALAAVWDEPAAPFVLPHARPRAGGPVLALVGSLSPVTRAQVAAARGYQIIAIEPARLLADPAYQHGLGRAAIAGLAQGHVMLVTNEAPGAEMARVAQATAALLGAVLGEADVSRIVVAGGDTSSHAAAALDAWGLSYRAPMVPGAPLCRLHSDDPHLDGRDIILKGGQMGPVTFFADVITG
ncbi:four-carbon acid sugar kinase family protein [Bradyrhizobium aeschynomenes]|uniref:four-carbon acid sugar kinase family protein n=1 Tax=Bradyrhizobium aeschynomenes TaxID=2734909 RepID=UPI001553BF25|nr:four-carbon acid sugar kinase family protein [Bradyrhizobium aeschynomenes]NPV20238.1 four-carbon acid sugar kinase family protein [Bradyrhizobium aeschynomenes]